MTGLTITCLQCGTRNSIHRLWCENCGTPVPCQWEPPKVNEAADSQRKKLYQHVIEDLATLKRSNRTKPETYDAIKAFCEDQLTQISEHAAEQARLQGLYQRVLDARHAAYAGRFRDAIDILQQGLADDRGEYQLQQAIDELNEKLERRDKLLQASHRAIVLFCEAKTSSADLRFEEAETKLMQASKLAPNNKRIMAALSQVRTRIAKQKAIEIAEQQACELATQASPQDDYEKVLNAKLIDEADQPVVNLAAISQPPTTSAVQLAPSHVESIEPPSSEPRIANASFVDDQEEIPSPRSRLIEEASQWSSIVKPFLLDNFGWFVGAFLVVAGFIVLVVTFWNSIEQNRILMHSFVYVALAVATGMFFSTAYFIRLKYPQLENSSNVLLVIVTLLIPLLFVAAMLTSLVPVTPADVALLQIPG